MLNFDFEICFILIFIVNVLRFIDNFLLIYVYILIRLLNLNYELFLCIF